MGLFIRRTKRKFFVYVSVALLGLGSLQGQVSEELTRYQAQFPDAKKVRILQETVVEIKMENDEVTIVQNIHEKDIYLDESATAFSKESLHFSSFFELQDIEASSFNYDGKKYREEEVKVFKEKDELEQSFYDDTKSVNFLYSNLREGSKTDLKYNQEVKNPRFLSSFYFGNYFPILKSKFQLIVANGIQLDFKKMNLGDVSLNFSEEIKKNTTIYTWELENTDEYDYEEGVSSFKKIVPHLIPIITSYPKGEENVTLLGGVEDLYGWYYSLVKNVNLDTPDANLVEVVNDLTKDKSSDLEKVKAIYYWTQENIKYIAFEYALGGFIPREANDVFTKKFGDCKDNSSILYQMLEIAELEGNLTWIGTRSIPYTYNEVPTPVVDNHMILTYNDQGTIYFLDATGRYNPIELPSSFIQGKEALISKKENFEVVTVPIVSASENLVREEIELQLKAGVLVGTAHTELYGYSKMDMFQSLERIDSDEKRKEYYKSALQKGNNKFLISEITEKNLYSYSAPFVLDYTFEVDNYVKDLNDEVYVNLNMNKFLLSYKFDEDRKYEMDFDYKYVNEIALNLTIPEGYVVDYLPPNYTVESDLMDVNITYTQKGMKILYECSAKLDFMTVPKNKQAEINRILKEVGKNFKEVIVLKKISE